MENENKNDSTWSGLKKTLIATLTTLITAGGAYLSTLLFSPSEPENDTKVESAQQTQPTPVIINLENNNTQSSTPTTIIKERIIEKEVKEEKKDDLSDSPW